jgi:hypothetical protein
MLIGAAYVPWHPSSHPLISTKLGQDISEPKNFDPKPNFFIIKDAQIRCSKFWFQSLLVWTRDLQLLSNNPKTYIWSALLWHAHLAPLTYMDFFYFIFYLSFFYSFESSNLFFKVLIHWGESLNSLMLNEIVSLLKVCNESSYRVYSSGCNLGQWDLSFTKMGSLKLMKFYPF